MRIAEFPPEERPRERLLKAGPGALADSELLAIFLRTGLPGGTVLDLARSLLVRFDGLAGVLGAAQPEALATRGLGISRYCALQAALELAKRVLESDLKREAGLTEPRLAAAYLRARLVGYPYEVFACLFLDNRHRVIAFEELFRGTIDGASVYPREVVRRAIAHNAAALILAHNHPSGVNEPSRADLAITRRLIDALALIDVRVLDHLIIGDGAPVSFAERGLL